MISSGSRLMATGAAAITGAASLAWFFLRRNRRSKCIYLDFNGTTPVYPAVTEAMMPYFTQHFGNPGSGHSFGDEPKKAIELARKRILLELLGEKDYSPSSCIFTACGTEADNMAIHLALASSSRKGTTPHIVTTNVEHPAVEKCLQHCEQQGICKVTYVPVGTNGCVESQDILDAMQDNTYVSFRDCLSFLTHDLAQCSRSPHVSE